jgi:NADP-dependent 3-hydroxy acid dehydrogenase YdfG
MEGSATTRPVLAVAFVQGFFYTLRTGRHNVKRSRHGEQSRLNQPTFANRVAVVTGAGGGIGKAIALALASRGATVALVGRSMENLNAAADAVRALSPQARQYQVDLTLDDSVRTLGRTLEQDFGALDLLVHSAGVITVGRLEVASVEDFDQQFAANVRAPYLLTQILLPILKSRQGQIVFINSSAGVSTRAEIGQFAATQHALKAIADTLRHEVNAACVRVLSIYPGRTATPRQAGIFMSEGRAYRPELLLQPEDVADVVVQALALPRTAEVTDIHVRPAMKSY